MCTSTEHVDNPVPVGDVVMMAMNLVLPLVTQELLQVRGGDCSSGGVSAPFPSNGWWVADHGCASGFLFAFRSTPR